MTKPYGLFSYFFQNCPLLDSNPFPSPPRLIPQKEYESIETVLSLTLKDGSNLKYPKNSLSAIGHIGKMPQILFRRLEAVETRFVLWGSGVMPYPLKDTTTSHEHGT